MNLAEALKLFQDHAAVNYPQTQRQADRAWEALKQHLTASELSSLSSARGHATGVCREGRQELDEVCAEIREAHGL